MLNSAITRRLEAELEPYLIDMTLGICLLTMFFVSGIGFGPILSYWLNPLRKHMDEKTKHEVLYGFPSLTHFFGLLVPCLFSTAATFFTHPTSLDTQLLGDPSLREPIGLLMFAARYGTFVLLGMMLVAHLLLKYVRPLRDLAYAKSPQIAADLYAR